MNKKEAYNLFEELIQASQHLLLDFTLNSSLIISEKIDKSVVTECDQYIDQQLSKICQKYGLQVVSEEGKHIKKIVESGTYITIDPVDGTLGYIDYVKDAIHSGNIKNFLQQDLGPEHDFALLLGIVENGSPRFGACYNYITKEKILIDAFDKNNLIRENNVRIYNADNVIYLDQRNSEDTITKEILSMSNTTPIKQATLGLKSIYTVLNSHNSAVTVHKVQTAGLWDVLPAAVAAKAFGGGVYDDRGNPLVLDKYIILPGNGATIVKGGKFQYILNKLKKNH